MRRQRNKTIDDLFQTILALETPAEAGKFFRDLLTKKEMLELANRWKVAQMLNNKVSYIEIEKATGMSSTTIARIQKWLTGGMGGYKLALQKLNTHHRIPSSFESGLR